MVYHTNVLQSAVLWNKGNLNFDLKFLPVEAQVAPVFAILAEDLDGDGHKDLVLGGNMYGVKPEVGRQDSNFGLLLRGDGKGNFTAVPNDESGIRVRGEVRDIQSIKVGKSKALLFGRNNDTMIVFSKIKP